MKIELYYYDVIEALTKHVNEKMKTDINFDDLDGDRHMEICIWEYPKDKANLQDRPKPTPHWKEFGEGDSISFFLD